MFFRGAKIGKIIGIKNRKINYAPMIFFTSAPFFLKLSAIQN